VISTALLTTTKEEMITMAGNINDQTKKYKMIFCQTEEIKEAMKANMVLKEWMAIMMRRDCKTRDHITK
jgi:hypothetical protein